MRRLVLPCMFLRILTPKMFHYQKQDEIKYSSMVGILFITTGVLSFLLKILSIFSTVIIYIDFSGVSLRTFTNTEELGPKST